MCVVKKKKNDLLSCFDTDILPAIRSKALSKMPVAFKDPIAFILWLLGESTQSNTNEVWEIRNTPWGKVVCREEYQRWLYFVVGVNKQYERTLSSVAHALGKRAHLSPAHLIMKQLYRHVVLLWWIRSFCNQIRRCLSVQLELSSIYKGKKLEHPVIYSRMEEDRKRITNVWITNVSLQY